MSGTSAPGKLVLCGEYAVLDGHPAAVAAVEVRAQARASAGPSAPLVARVLELARARGLAFEGGVEVDTAAFRADGRKLGLGSSAAAAVAAAALLVRRATGALDVDATWQLARDAHRAFQGGGSGIDVAASCYGGLVRFSTRAPPAPAPALPRALEVLVVDTGSSTSTQGFVDRVLALPDRSAYLEPLARSAHSFLDACARDDAAALLSAVERACAGMAELGAVAGVDIVSEPHARVAALAAAHSGAAKPSGAGGGDVALAFVPRQHGAALRAALWAAALPVVELRLGAAGVRLEP